METCPLLRLTKRKKKERDRIRTKEEGSIMRDFTFIIITVIRRKRFTALKVHRQCQLVLLVKVGRKQGIALRNEGGEHFGRGMLEHAAQEKS